LVKTNGGSADLFKSASFRLSFYEEIHDKMKEIAAALSEDENNGRIKFTGSRLTLKLALPHWYQRHAWNWLVIVLV